MRLVRLMLMLSAFAAATEIIALAARLPWQVTVIGGIVVVVVSTKRKFVTKALGSAAWATSEELEQAGMLDGQGLCVGVVCSTRPSFWRSLRGLFDWKKPAAKAVADFVFSLRKGVPRYRGIQKVTLSHAVHTAVIAPTGAGKGVSLIIPFLRSCPDSMVVIDPKGGNFKLTAEARMAMGHRVFVLDPFRIATQTPDMLNVLASIDTNNPTALDDCRAIANQIVNRNYQQHARELLTPDEIINQPQRKAITLTQNVRPIATHLVRYYEEPRGNGWWNRFRTQAEIWTVAFSLLVLLGVLGWCLATMSFSPTGGQ